MDNGASRRVAVVAGVRTPFVKAGTAFKDFSFQQLGAHVSRALIERSGVKPERIDQFVFSTVLLDPRTPNWAREILFAAGLPKSIYAYSVSNNCVSGLVAITSLFDQISLGRVHCGIAGGSESMSNPALLFDQEAASIFFELSRARSLKDRAALALGFRPRHFLPKPPGITEPSTGLTMGQHMEITAKELGVTRKDQDEVALRSHQNAARAQQEGVFKDLIAPLAGVDRDLLVRADTSAEKLAGLKPVFDRSEKGTLTAGNSSPLTDGAAAVLLVSDARAREEGREVLAYVKDYEYAAMDPNEGLLMAPALAVPRLLERNNLTLQDFDLIEIHEAFGAQVVANVQAWEQGWRLPPIGKIDWNKVNVLGGSIAIGHPFAATGGRIISALAKELSRRQLKRGLISICAAGAMAGAIILERE